MFQTTNQYSYLFWDLRTFPNHSFDLAEGCLFFQNMSESHHEERYIVQQRKQMDLFIGPMRRLKLEEDGIPNSQERIYGESMDKTFKVRRKDLSLFSCDSKKTHGKQGT